MSVQIVKKSPIDMKLADADDETLDAIARLRKKIEKQEDRIAFVKGLYFISLVDADYTEDERLWLRVRRVRSESVSLPLPI